jgi:hypothetical protein
VVAVLGLPSRCRGSGFRPWKSGSFHDRFDNSTICDEEKEGYNHDEPSDSKDKWEEKGLKLEGYSFCSIEAHTIARQNMEVLKDEEKSESTKSDLDDMWYTGDKESNIHDFDDEDWDDNEDFKEETNANVVDGLNVPHDEMEGCKKVTKRHLHSLRLIRLQQR